MVGQGMLHQRLQVKRVIDRAIDTITIIDSNWWMKIVIAMMVYATVLAALIWSSGLASNQECPRPFTLGGMKLGGC